MSTSLRFDKFTIDWANQRLFRDSRALPITPKAFAVLRFLAERPENLATKDELLDAVWPGVHVSDGVLKVAVAEIRKVLGDSPTKPRFIETVHRRGYRFIATVEMAARPAQPAAESLHGPRSSDLRRLIAWPPRSRMEQRVSLKIVGREADLAEMTAWFRQALAGRRVIGFVTGEPGIGKTRLVEDFVIGLATTEEAWVTGAQSVETYSENEPYRPVLDALGRLCRGPARQSLLDKLRRSAPTWLVQMPWLLEPADRTSLEREIVGATRERMLREIAELLEAVTAEIPLVLVLEDLHWSDRATVDLLSTLARRGEPARLLVIGTYRPADVIIAEHPLKGLRQELRLQGQCDELALGLLSEADVARYLAMRFPAGTVPARFSHFVHQRTDGNALFLTTLIDDLLDQGVLAARNGALEMRTDLGSMLQLVPESLRHMIERQVDRLADEERRVIQAASVIGQRFSSAAVAAALDDDVARVEEIADRLSRARAFVDPNGIIEWPDGTRAGGYRFAHSLYPSILYRRLAPTARARFHARVGARLERAFGDRAREIAAELAVHFEEGASPAKAAEWCNAAARVAMRRHSNDEAIRLLSRGLEQIDRLPETPVRIARELSLLIWLGQALQVTRGYADPQVESVFSRARTLSRKVDATPDLFVCLLGLWGFYLVRGELAEASKLADEVMGIAAPTEFAPLLLGGHYALGLTLLYRGEFAAARQHLDRCVTLYDPSLREYYGLDSAQDPKASAMAYAALARWFLGDEDEARRLAEEALSFARGLDHPFSELFVLDVATTIDQCCGDVAFARERADTLVTLATEREFPLWLASGTILHGWARAEGGEIEAGLARIREGLDRFRAAGGNLAQSYFLSLQADLLGRAGRSDEGLALLDEARTIAEQRGERFFEAEIHRLEGELRLRLSRKDSSPAEKCFRTALEVAERQGAESLARRARASLAALIRGKRSR